MKKKKLMPMRIEVGCVSHDEQRVVAGLVRILNRKVIKPAPPAGDEKQADELAANKGREN